MSTQKTISYNDEIKRKDKSTVNGYIRKIEPNIFSLNIPMVVNDLCIKYYHISKDRFDPILHGKDITVSDNKITFKISNKFEYSNSSAFLSNIVSNGKHQWKFKIVNKKTYPYIGVRPNKTDPNDNELNDNNELNQCVRGYGLFGLWYPRYYGLLRGLKYNDSRTLFCVNKKYCPTRKNDGDIIDMYLDLNKFELSFVINNKHYGKAFDVDKTSYRAVCSHWGFRRNPKSFELLFYKTMH